MSPNHFHGMKILILIIIVKNFFMFQFNLGQLTIVEAVAYVAKIIHYLFLDFLQILNFI